MLIEIIGYLGMMLVVSSFMFKNVKILRSVNIAGAVLSCLYGFLTLTYPTAILNLILIIVNAGMLIKDAKSKN